MPGCSWWPCPTTSPPTWTSPGPTSSWSRSTRSPSTTRSNELVADDPGGDGDVQRVDAVGEGERAPLVALDGDAVVLAAEDERGPRRERPVVERRRVGTQ